MVGLGRYRHFKGNEYEVIAIAKHSETEEEMVVYKAIDGGKVSNGDFEIWVRPLKMWTEMITRDGKIFPRFEKINED